MPPLLGNDDVHNEQDDDEDSDSELYNQDVNGTTDSESHSNTSYHSSEENQHNTVADQVRLGMVYERDSETRNENISIVTKLHLQQKLYDTGPLEDYCSDTEKCLQRYFKTIYRQVNSLLILKKTSNALILLLLKIVITLK